MRQLALVILVAALALIPASVYAQQGGADGGDGLALAINEPLSVNAADSVDTAIVISDDALVRGTVDDMLLVIDGDAVVTGTVKDIVVISGNLNLGGRSLVQGDIRLIDSDIAQAETATVQGSIDEGWGIGWWWWAISPVLFWIAMTIAVVLAGLIFAGIGGRQLTGAARLLTGEAGRSVLAAVIAWIGIPLLAVLAMITVVGIPFGIGLLIFLLPAIWFLGYLVTGTRIGLLLLEGTSSRVVGERPYLAALVGLLLLQLVALIPAVGIVVALLAGLWGSGALMMLIWRGWKGPRAAQPAAPTPTTA